MEGKGSSVSCHMVGIDQQGITHHSGYVTEKWIHHIEVDTSQNSRLIT